MPHSPKEIDSVDATDGPCASVVEIFPIMEDNKMKNFDYNFLKFDLFFDTESKRLWRRLFIHHYSLATTLKSRYAVRYR